jgi:hypothetical protein
MGGWMDGRESRVKDCLQQSKIWVKISKNHNFTEKTTVFALITYPLGHTRNLCFYVSILKGLKLIYGVLPSHRISFTLWLANFFLDFLSFKNGSQSKTIWTHRLVLTP